MSTYEDGYRRTMKLAGYGWGDAAKDTVTDPLGLRRFRGASSVSSPNVDPLETVTDALLPFATSASLAGAGLSAPILHRTPLAIGGGLLGYGLGSVVGNKRTADRYQEAHPIKQSLGFGPYS